MVHTSIFYLPEVLEQILHFLAIDKSLYPALLVFRLWYRCGTLILWRRIELKGNDLYPKQSFSDNYNYCKNDRCRTRIPLYEDNVATFWYQIITFFYFFNNFAWFRFFSYISLLLLRLYYAFIYFIFVTSLLRLINIFFHDAFLFVISLNNNSTLGLI
jgi:hypothetical protein